MTKQERELTKKKRNDIALKVVQEALDNGFSMYDIEELAASIECLARYQKFESRKADTENLPQLWDA